MNSFVKYFYSIWLIRKRNTLKAEIELMDQVLIPNPLHEMESNPRHSIEHYTNVLEMETRRRNSMAGELKRVYESAQQQGIRIAKI